MEFGCGTAKQICYYVRKMLVLSSKYVFSIVSIHIRAHAMIIDQSEKLLGFVAMTGVVTCANLT
jgi:hypothetical protein